MWKDLTMKEKAAMMKVAIQNGITDLDDIIKRFDEGGPKDSWKPQYWFTPSYEAESLKEAITKAYDEDRKGKNLLYKGKAYKALLNEQEEKEYNVEKQHQKNRSITNEQVVDAYLNNVVYTMENPTNKGFRDGLYYPYADVSSPYNWGPGINYTSEVGKNLDRSGKTGYSKEELNELLKPMLLENMEGIMLDLHNKYNENADTMSLGNRLMLLDIAHNVRPKGKRRANMPSAWPSLVDAMMSGNTKKAKRNTYSGSKRRSNMRNDLLWKDIVDASTVKNR